MGQECGQLHGNGKGKRTWEREVEEKGKGREAGRKGLGKEKERGRGGTEKDLREGREEDRKVRGRANIEGKG